MLSDVYFYMTREDIHEVLSELIASEPLQFVPVESHAAPRDIVVYALDEIPNLGLACYGSELSEKRLLVMTKGATPCYMRIEHTDKTVSYLVGPDQNHDSLIIWPSGEWERNCIIRGHYGPSSDSTFAVNLYRKLKRLLKQRCILANKHYLGQRALQKLKEGAILSSAATANPSCHFRLPE